MIRFRVTGSNGDPDYQNILVLSQESGKIVETDRAGNILSSLTIVNDPGDISIPNQQHEGLTMDRNGYLYIVNENGGGDINHIPCLAASFSSSAVGDWLSRTTLKPSSSV